MSTDPLEIVRDPDRLAILRATGLLDSEPEEAFDRLTRAAKGALDVPMSFVTLVDEERQFFKSHHGLPEPWASRRETPVTWSICRFVVARAEPFTVADTREHPDTRGSPAIERLGVRAYAGAPIVGPEGARLGSFAACDTGPREWTVKDVGVLRGLARVVSQEITRRGVGEGSRAGEERPVGFQVDYREFVERLPVGIVVHSHGEILYANPETASVLQMEDPDRVVGLQTLDLVPPEARGEVARRIRRVQEEREPVEMATYPVALPGNGERVVEAMAIPVRFDGEDAVQVMFRDVTERVRAEEKRRRSDERFRTLFEDSRDAIYLTTREGRILEVNQAFVEMYGYSREELEEMALHDELTGLPNRALFWDRLEHTIARARREEQMVAVLFADLARFKVINDSLGHGAGDQVLQEVARRLGSAFREEDTVARFGGDEFTVLLEDVEGEEAVEEATRRFLDSLEEPFHPIGETVHLSASVGGAPARPWIEELEGGRDKHELVRRADAAMFRAKERPGVSLDVYDPELDSGETGRIERERELREAIEAEQFTCHFQPIVDLGSGRIVGVEQLARWEHPERGAVPPAEFIPLAEETGLIVPLGERLLETACRAMAGWSGARREEDAGDRDLVLYVNLSARQFEDPGLTDGVVRILGEVGLAPSTVRFEVTESIVMRGLERVDELRRLGIGVTVDDFGTGYSSLNYLKRLDVDGLKIDMSFVRGLGRDSRDEAIVRTIVTLARELELDVIAEGIEEAEQLRVLREHGCEVGQGFYFARPMPAAEFAELLEADPGW